MQTPQTGSKESRQKKTMKYLHARRKIKHQLNMYARYNLTSPELLGSERAKACNPEK